MAIEKEIPLFSFVITSYKNHEYIYEALDSVFSQDYPRIQLIISDDGSQDFDKNAVCDYVETYRAENIKDIQIYAHGENRGTVRNMEFCRQKAEGDYIMYMAADDALNENGVLSRYAAEFERLGKGALVLCSKVAMCGENLSDIEKYEPSNEGIHAIRDQAPETLFGRMTHTWTIPTTSCCYRKEVYEVTGGYDTEYFIMEDGLLFMKLVRNGHRIHWVDDLVAARHRGGGISHGNSLNLSEAYRKYRYDEIIFFKKEVLPFQERLLSADKELMQAKWEYLQRAYFETFELPNMSGSELFKYQMKDFPRYMKSILRRTKEKTVAWIEDNFLNVNLMVVSAICTSVYLLLLILPISIATSARIVIMSIMQTMALISVGFAVFLRVMRVVRQLWLTLKYIFTGR